MKFVSVCSIAPLLNHGSVGFYLQNEPPDEDLEANWLPVPEGPFLLTMRIYLPEPEVLDFTWKPPHVVRMSDDNDFSGRSGCATGALAFPAFLLLLVSSAIWRRKK